MGLTALLLLQHARAAARFDAEGALVLLDDQDRSLWNQKMIAEGLARCPASNNEIIEIRQVQEMSDFPADVQEAAAGFAELQGHKN